MTARNAGCNSTVLRTVRATYFSKSASETTIIPSSLSSTAIISVWIAFIRRKIFVGNQKKKQLILNNEWYFLWRMIWIWKMSSACYCVWYKNFFFKMQYIIKHFFYFIFKNYILIIKYIFYIYIHMWKR